MIASYNNAINNTTLYGPTYFSNIIETVNTRCESVEVNAYNQEYHILLILTDGIINDMSKTID